MPNPIRTGLIGPALAFVVLLLVAAPVAAQSEPVYLWDQFDTEIVVNEDGSFDVVEQQTIEFQQGTFHFGRRELPRTYFESADSWRVTASDGTDYRQAEEGEEPYTFVVQDYPSRYTVHWYFPEQQDFTDTFTISYRVHGGLRYYDGGDQLHWKAVYPDRGASVLDGAVRVEVPAAIQVYAAYVNGRDARDRASASVGDDGRSVVYTLDRALRDGEDFEVRVEFAPGVVGGSAAEWQHALDEQAAAAEAQELRDARERVLWPVAALVVLAGGLALLFVHWFSAGRDKPAGPIADYLTEPPEGVRPGMVNPLLRETCEMSDIVATAVDLAQRSFLRISQNGSRFTFTKTQDAAGLLPYEEAVMDGLFRWNDKDEVTLEYLRTRFSQVIPTIEARLYWQMVNDGYFQSDIERVRRRYRSRALPGLIFSAFAFFALPLVTGAPASRWLGAALGIVMLALFLLARHMPQKTPKGSDAAARLRAFERYLRNIEQYADMADVQRVWDRWLPYAVAFGIDEQYIDLFAAADAPAPAWYASEPSAPASGMADAPVIVLGPVPAGAPPSLASPGAGGPGSALPASGSGTGDGLAQVSRGLGGSLTAMSAGLGAMLAATSRSFAVLPERMPPLNVEGKPGAAGGPRRHGDPGSKGLFTVNKGGSRRRGGRGGGSFSGGGRRGGSGGGGGSGGFG